MLTAGYSGTPLPKKLGIKPGMTVCFVDDPPEFRVALGPLENVAHAEPGRKLIDCAVLFCRDRLALSNQFSRLAKRLVPNGMLWVAWPKKSSGVATDLSEDVIRKLGIAAGLVDIKVCAITDIWSGLKFVIPLKDRPKAK